MKHIPKPVRRRLFWKRRSERQLKRRISHNLWRTAKLGNPLGEQVVLYRQGQRMRVRASGRMEMPEVFCLDENPDETIQYLAAMRDRIFSRAVEAGLTTKRRGSGPMTVDGYYDFGTIRHLGVSAALILAALFDRQKRITGWKLSTINEHNWDPDVLAVFRAVGFHDLLEMTPNRGPMLDLGDFKILRFRSGDNADGKLVGTTQEALAGLLPAEEGQKLLYAEPYGGMLEAILNSSTWAYPEDQKWSVPAVKKWWMTGAVNLPAKSVSLVVYDQGVTIPVSLPRWTHYSEMEGRMQKIAQRLGFTGAPDDVRNDGAAIAFATKIARSKSALPQHGKGLHTMLEVAERARQGRLRILSRNGEYIWERGRSGVIRSRPDSIGGTLVEWTLNL